ncbi:hypothetical protein PAGU2196_04390 [Pseudomonas sp. PAGU 2196]|nr:hypothetical protein PAGU2196_04390 [Pseudomonas sp. PAGU 2196]
MKIRRLNIKNFRGVSELEWSLPMGHIFCLIGKGDSAKSTILEAIRYVFYPQWNLTLSDSDFHNVTSHGLHNPMSAPELTRSPYWPGFGLSHL